MKIIIFAIFITTVYTSPVDKDSNFKCFTPIDIRRCKEQCKNQGYQYGICNKLNGCVCDGVGVPYKDENIQCFDDKTCRSYCKQKGFDNFFCNKENACNCLTKVIPHEIPNKCITEEDHYACREKCRTEGFSQYFCVRFKECYCEVPYEPY